MSIWQRLRYWWLGRTPEGNLLAIREHLTFFDVDVSNLTDEEIGQAVLDASRAMTSFGLTADEAMTAFTRHHVRPAAR